MFLNVWSFNSLLFTSHAESNQMSRDYNYYFPVIYQNCHNTLGRTHINTGNNISLRKLGLIAPICKHNWKLQMPTVRQRLLC